MGIFVCFVAMMALILPEANGCSKQTEVHAGSSRNNKVKIVQHFKPIRSCPSTITKAERTNTDYSDANDMFNVTVIDGKGKLRVERIDGTNWGMDLKFKCCGYGDYFKTPFKSKECTARTTCKSCHVSICVGSFPSLMLATSIVLLCILFLTTYESTLFFSGISRM